MIYTFLNSGIEEHVFFSEKAVEEILLSLLQHLTALQRSAGHRIIVFLAAPPETICQEHFNQLNKPDWNSSHFQSGFLSYMLY